MDNTTTTIDTLDTLRAEAEIEIYGAESRYYASLTADDDFSRVQIRALRHAFLRLSRDAAKIERAKKASAKKIEDTAKRFRVLIFSAKNFWKKN